MINIILVRHGETAHNKNKIMQGQLNTSLSKVGIAQAKATAKYFSKKKIDAAYCSDLNRAKKTCEIILENHKNIPITFDRRLRERHYGVYQGRQSPELHRAVKRSGKSFIDFRPKSGESIIDQYNRVKDFLASIIKIHKKGNILVVTHGGVITNMLIHVANDKHDNFRKYHPQNTAITILKVDKKIKIHTLNYIKHLKNI